jgi:hypothetical protein
MSGRYARYLAVGLLLAMMNPICLVAQSGSVATIGDRMRVTTTAAELTRIGNLKSLDAESVVLSHKRERQGGTMFDRPPSTIPISSVLKLEVSRGRTGIGQRVFLGALLGLAGGGVLAGVLGSKATQDCGCDDPGGGVLLAVPGALVGAIFGGLIGASRSPTQWESIPIPRKE